LGADSQAKASLGSWLVLAEWIKDKPVCILSFKVDNKKVKADQWYKIVNKKLVKVN
jgi:hypothetical protein